MVELEGENADLKRRLGLDSSTSSQLPSSDGLRRKPASLRERSGKASGGQAGHKGDRLKRVVDPDRIVIHEARACRHCGAGLRLSMARGMETRQVFELPEKMIEVTEHRRFVYACAGCGERTGAAFSRWGEGARAIWRAAARGGGLSPSAAVDPRGKERARRSPTSSAFSFHRSHERDGLGEEKGQRACARRRGSRALSGRDRLPRRGQNAMAAQRLQSTASRTSGAMCRTRLPGRGRPRRLQILWRLAGASHALCNAHRLRELKAADRIRW